jgi:hypothetical protein
MFHTERAETRFEFDPLRLARFIPSNLLLNRTWQEETIGNPNQERIVYSPFVADSFHIAMVTPPGRFRVFPLLLCEQLSKLATSISLFWRAVTRQIQEEEALAVRPPLSTDVEALKPSDSHLGHVYSPPERERAGPQAASPE